MSGKSVLALTPCLSSELMIEIRDFPGIMYSLSHFRASGFLSSATKALPVFE